MRKLLGKGPAEASPSSSVDHPNATLSTSSPGVTSASTSTSTSATLPATGADAGYSTLYRPQGSQDASFDAGSPIDCLDQSPDGHSAILAGRHILKIVTLDGASVQSGVDLRAAILAQPTVKNSTVSVSDQLSIKDVKWLKGRGDTTIFTACANGKIFQYDLTRLGGGADGAPMEVIHMREDSRQINTLDINPRSSRMLAGSQDGIVRCFDIMNPVRTHTGHLTFRAIQSFKCNAGGIQCLQWSPNIEGAFYFACGTEQGVVLKWDIRKSTAPVLRINAHDTACTSLAWHSDGDHLVSGGWDKKCHVWDVSATAEKRQKPKCTISAPAAIADVSWRPATWSATAQGRRAAQLAVTYDESSRQGHNVCHVWDLARPTMPFKKVYNFDQPPSALLWHDQDLLWTVGHDGLFNQFDIAYAPRMIDEIPTSVLAFSSRGEAMALLDERPAVRRPHRSVVPADMLPPSYSSSPTAPMLGSSRSDSEDEVAGSFLGAHRVRPKHRRVVANTSRSAQTLSTTPPGGPDSPTLALEQSLRVTGLYRSQQAMTVGRLLGAAKVPVYEYLSTQYLEALQNMLPYKNGAPSLQERTLSIIHSYAKSAETIGFFRLAQVWRLLAHAMKLVLGRRAQNHLDRRSGELERSEKARRKARSPLPLRALDADRSGPLRPDDNRTGGMNPSTGTDKAVVLRSLLAEEFESTSNVPTPVARPIDGSDPLTQHDLSHPGHKFEYGKKLTPVQEAQSFTLPPPLQPRPPSRKRLDFEPISTYSNESDAYASTEGYDFYDTETISKAIDVPSPDDHGDRKVDSDSLSSVRRVVSRHDSDESFGQMFSISSGSRQTTQLTGSSASSMRKRPLRSNAQVPQLARSLSTGEYESRIRGAKIEDHETPDLHHTTSAPTGIEQVAATQSSEDDYVMATQTTADSVDSQRGEMHPKPDNFPRDTPHAAIIGASPYHSFEFKYGDLEQPQDTDYLPWSDDPPFPQPIAWEEERPFAHPSPLDPYKVVSWALQFETQSSALNASAMIMLLRPLLRDDTVIDPFLAAATIKQHHNRLMGMGLFTQAALLRNLCVKGWPGEPLLEWGDNYPAVLRAAQHNSTAALTCTNCHKPREIDRHSKNQLPNPVWKCERCRAVMAPCAVCLHRDNAEPSAAIEISAETIRSTDAGNEAPMSMWWYCPGCSHGGHASCLQGWHAVTAGEESAFPVDAPSEPGLLSDGCCPLDGCGHACLPGKYRAETTVARTEEVGRAVRDVNRRVAGNVRDGLGGGANPRFQVGRYNTGAIIDADPRVGGKASREGSVYGDGNEVPQSRAVDSARESLAGSGGLRHVSSAMHLGSDRGGLFSSSPGREGIGSDGSRERERRRSVRFGASTVLDESAGA